MGVLSAPACSLLAARGPERAECCKGRVPDRHADHVLVAEVNAVKRSGSEHDRAVAGGKVLKLPADLHGRVMPPVSTWWGGITRATMSLTGMDSNSSMGAASLTEKVPDRVRGAERPAGERPARAEWARLEHGYCLTWQWPGAY